MVKLEMVFIYFIIIIKEWNKIKIYVIKLYCTYEYSTGKIQ